MSFTIPKDSKLQLHSDEMPAPRYKTLGSQNNGVAAIAGELRRVMRNSSFASGRTLMGGVEISQAEEERVNKLIREHFKLWSESWVFPLIDEILAKYYKSA